MPEDELLPFAGSATHREIHLGLLGESSEPERATGVLCAVRTFTGDPRGPGAESFVDLEATNADRIRNLTAAVLGRVPSHQVLRYAVDWRDAVGLDFDEDVLATAYLGLLRPKLEAVLAVRTAAREAAAARGQDSATLLH